MAAGGWWCSERAACTAAPSLMQGDEWFGEVGILPGMVLQWEMPAAVYAAMPQDAVFAQWRSAHLT